jgi:hypothetical protein
VFLFAPIRWTFRLISLVVLGAIVYVVVSGVQVVDASHLPTAVTGVGPAQTIVVLGAPVQGSQPGADLSGRLQQALLLYEAKRAPAIIVTGPPTTSGTSSVGAVSTAWLTRQGVPKSKVTTVSASNAASGLGAVSEMLGRGAQVIVVTDAIDSLWTRGVASSDGLVADISPAFGSEKTVFTEIGPLWRQATGVAVGRAIGYGRATWAAQ